MSWSLNEIEALARKAAKGGGYSWGMAEDAGRAVRWLCARGLPGADELVSLLRFRDEAGFAQSGAICGLQCGAEFSDGARQSAPETEVTAPLLMVPFLSWSAIGDGVPVTMVWDGGHVSCTSVGQVKLQGDAPQFSTVVTLQEADDQGQAFSVSDRAEVAEDIVQQLAEYAGRTYAPATEESRLAGAGAGLSDND